MTQDWEELPEFPGCSVSDQGLIDHSGRLLRSRQNKQGIVMVGLWNERLRVQKTRSVALLVARTFVENPNPYRFNSIIHLNGDKTDCRAINLMWRTRPFALQYHKMFDNEPFRLAVRIPALGRYFSSLRDACTTYGLIERAAFLNVQNQEPCWPYLWIMEAAE